MTILKDQYINGMVVALTAQQLAQCVQDVIRWKDEGLLGAGVLFKLATHSVAEMGLDRTSSMQQLEAAVLREVSLRFVAMHTGLPDNTRHERCV